MRIRIVGDHSDHHGGSAAVFRAARARGPGGRVCERRDWDGEQRVFATLGFPDDPGA